MYLVTYTIRNPLESQFGRRRNVKHSPYRADAKQENVEAKIIMTPPQKKGN